MKKYILRIELTDVETGTTEILYLRPFKTYENDDASFIREEKHHDTIFMKMLVDEGYAITEYYYPVDRFYISNAIIQED